MIHIKRFIFNPFSENTYLLFDDTKEAVIIDCGCVNQTEEAAITKTIREENLAVKHLLTTHFHLDHTIGNAFIYRTFGVRPEVAASEEGAIIPTLNQQAKDFGIPGDFEEIKPLGYIKAGDEIKFGNSILTAIDVSGHAPASLAYYSKADNAVFTGDAIFLGSIGRTDLWGSNHNLLITNLKNNLLTLPDDTVIYPGHGEKTTVRAEKAHNPYIR